MLVYDKIEFNSEKFSKDIQATFQQKYFGKPYTEARGEDMTQDIMRALANSTYAYVKEKYTPIIPAIKE